MKIKCDKGNLNFLLQFIPIILFLISCILFEIQSFKNYYFTKKKTSKQNISERILYRYFSEEIYNNIRLHPICKVYNSEMDDIPNNIKNFSLEVKLDTYFDCQDVKKGLLNEAECQDKIISNLTCCKSECCPRTKNKCNNYNFDLRKSYDDDTILTYNDEERYDDPKRRYCKYFNKYSNTTSILLNKKYYIEECSYNYEDLLLGKVKNAYVGTEIKEGYVDCGEIDSMHNHLFLMNDNCPVNLVIRDGENIYFDHLQSTNLKIFIRNILSEIPPDIHERRDQIINEEIKNNITVKNYYKIIKQNENYYKKQDVYFYIHELTDIYNKYKYKVNNFQKIYWYTGNYIGFKSKDDFSKFNKVFSDNGNNNNLYRITNDLRPSIISICIWFIFIILCVGYLILIFVFKKITTSSIKKKTFIIINGLIFFSGLILYCIYSEIKYKKININMDAYYKEIIDLYNKRRKQEYFLASVILNVIALVFYILLLYLWSETEKKNKKIDKGSENSDLGDRTHYAEENKQAGNNEEIYKYRNDNLMASSMRESIRNSIRNSIKNSINNFQQLDIKQNREKNN